MLPLGLPPALRQLPTLPICGFCLCRHCQAVWPPRQTAWWHAEDYVTNPPPAMDPVQGQAALASLPAYLAGTVCEVPNSQEDSDTELDEAPPVFAGAPPAELTDRSILGVCLSCLK